jgi:hypothetical protein
MDKAIEQIFKGFSHLGREIQIYLFSGLIIAVNVLIIDHFYFNSTLLTFIQTNNLTIPVGIVLYLLGQFCMGFFYLILEITNLHEKIKKKLKFNYSFDYKYLPKIYKERPELYNYFIERYNILTMMRWTISAACFINLIIDIIVLIIKDIYWQILMTTIIFTTGSITFYLLSMKTENEYVERINLLKDEQ